MNASALVADNVSVAGPHDPLVVAPNFSAEPGQVTLVPVDPGLATVAFALALSGRVALLTGSVSLDGDASPAALQQATRLVDVDGVTAPEDALSVRATVAEELSLRDLPSRRHEVLRTLETHGLSARAHERWDALPADTRTGLLIDLAAAQKGTGVIVVAGPDRHLGSTGAWTDHADRAAADGHTVIALIARAALR